MRPPGLGALQVPSGTRVLHRLLRVPSPSVTWTCPHTISGATTRHTCPGVGSWPRELQAIFVLSFLHCVVGHGDTRQAYHPPVQLQHHHDCFEANDI